MAAATAVKGEEPTESGQGESQTSVSLKVEGDQDGLKNVNVSEKQSNFVDNGRSSKEKNDKAEKVAKKFVDAPLPATNPWTKRSASLTSAVEVSHPLPSPEPKKDVPAIERANTQGNGVSKPVKSATVQVSNSDSSKTDKPKSQKSKTDVNGSKQVDSSVKPKIKKFGDEYVEAPLPTVNPWKKSVGTSAVAAVTLGAELFPTPAASLSPALSVKDIWSSAEQHFATDSRPEVKTPDTATNDAATPDRNSSPALADDNWPTLHEVKVTEPNLSLPVKATKPAKPKVNSTTLPTPSGLTPVSSTETASAPVVSTMEARPSPDEHAIVTPVERIHVQQTQLHTDSGGDDSSKENKDNSTNSDDTNGVVKSKKAAKPKWQRMEIDHPKADRRNRRSRSQGRNYSPGRRDGRQPADRFHRPQNRRSDGPESQNWRANMISNSAAAATTDTTTTTTTTTTSSSEHVRSGPGGNFSGNRGPRGRGGNRGNAPRRGGSRGRGGIRDTKSPPFQANPASWATDQVFPPVSADPESVPVMLGMDPNLFIQEQLLNILGQASMYYEPPAATPTYASETLKHQVEYYFSEDNLVKDLFLRKKMDKQGWVKLELVLSFNKVKELKADHTSLIQAIKESDKLELSENEGYVRPLHTPELWPIEDDFTSLPPPPAVQRVAAMSTLHSDAPEFVPGQPFILRNLTSDAPESIPAASQDAQVSPNSGSQQTLSEEDDSLLCDSASSLTISSR